jgi:hypothetical protein
MADILEIGNIKDTSSLNTGAMRRSYSSKKKKKKKSYKKVSNKYVAGK